MLALFNDLRDGKGKTNKKRAVPYWTAKEAAKFVAQKVEAKPNGDPSPAEISLSEFNFFKRTFQKMETIEVIPSY